MKLMFKHKLIILFLLAGSIPLVAISVLLFNIYSNSMTTRSIEFSTQIIELTETNINNQIDAQQDIINSLPLMQFLVDLPNIEDLHYLDRVATEQELESIFNSIIYTYDEIEVIMYIDRNQYLHKFGSLEDLMDEANKHVENFEQNLDNFLVSDIYNKTLNNHNKPLWDMYMQDDYDSVYMFKNFISLQTTQNLGTFVFVVELDKLMDEVYADNLLDPSKIFITDENNIVISESSDYLGTFLGTEFDATQYDNNHYIYVSGECKNGWQVNQLIATDDLLITINDMIMIAVVVFTVFFLAASIVAVFFSSSISRRINLLLNKMNRAKNGDLTQTTKIKGSDEISQLSNNFDDMLEQLRQYIHKIYVIELEKKKSALQLLQFQINPHFLYNTLETINAMALEEGNFKIRTMVQTLGDMFRYSTSAIDESHTELRYEIENIENYIYLQNIRFDNRLVVNYDIPDDALRFKTVKFILQPIVENAIKHAFVNKAHQNIISISAEHDDKDLTLKVSDNGVGMDDELIAELNTMLTKMTQNDKFGIGIKNINDKIKLMYSEEYGITAHKNTPCGMTFVVKIKIM